MTDLPISIRDAVDDDRNLIHKSWKLGLRRSSGPHVCSAPGCPSISCLSGRRYFQAMEGRINTLLERTARVACNTERVDQILGFAVAEASGLHYVYVKQGFRGHRVAARLVSDLAETHDWGDSIRCSHWTKAAEEYADLHPSRFTYSPSMLEESP